MWRALELSGQQAFRKQLLKAVIYPLLFAFFLVSVLVFQLYRLTNSSKHLFSLDAISRQISDLESSILNSQNSVRGFLIRNDVLLLEPYIDFSNSAHLKLQELRAQLKEENGQPVLMTQIETLINQWLSEANQSINQKKLHPSSTPVLSDAGLNFVESIRRHLNEIEEIEQHKAQRAQAEMKRSEDFFLFLILTAVSLSFIALSIFARRQLRALAAHFGKVQLEISRSESQFRQLADTLPQLVFISDPVGLGLWFNEKWHNYTGTESKEMEGWGWQVVHHPGFLPEVLRRWDETVRNGTPMEMEFPLRGKDGSYKWFLCRTTPIRDDLGKIIKWFGTCTDIELSRHMREDKEFLAFSSDKINYDLDFNHTLQSVAECAVPRLADWVFIAFLEDHQNQRVSQIKMLHHNPQKSHLIDQFYKYSDKWNARVIWERIQNGKPEVVQKVSDELILQKVEGDRNQLELVRQLGTESYALFPLFSREAFLGAICFFRGDSGRNFSENDIQLCAEFARKVATSTENARLHEEVKAAIQQRDEFLSIASHELKTPLTSLLLQIQMLSRTLNQKTTEPEVGPPISRQELTGIVDFCQAQLGRVTDLLDELFDLTRIRLGRIQLNRFTVDLAQLVKEVCNRFQAEAKEKGASITLICEKPLQAQVDTNRFVQIVSNLITNAIKYGEGKPIQVFLYQSGTHSILVVQDEGVGISKDLQPKLFQRFERIRPSNQTTGLGLGLYITRQIVEAHGGTITVKSELGKGSAFTVSIPL
jgi:PAS domain S-box-containing protein